MKRAIVGVGLSCLALAASGSAAAAPKHAICSDLGPTFPVGVSHYAAAGNWAQTAAQQHGVKWKFLYVYLVPTDDPSTQVGSWIQSKIAIAKSVGAMPVFTFYQLLELATRSGVTGGSEAEIVKKGLKNSALMKKYFDNFIFLLKTVSNAGVPVIVDVEPDSWGFMIWAMGVDGNSDATSIPVKVKGSGHPDVTGFPDHAGGFGRALLKLRDQYAPSVRMGWHASNFRAGAGGNIVASFYSSMGEYDVLFTEHPHVEGNEKTWWLPWDEAKVTKNLGFYSALTGAAHVPILLWQEQIGSTDFHLFSQDDTMRARFAKAGVGGVLFSMRGKGDPDKFRADEQPNLATVPPPGTGAGGTAADMRARLTWYAQHPLVWPAGSLCVGTTLKGALPTDSEAVGMSAERPAEPRGTDGRWFALAALGATVTLRRRRGGAAPGAASQG